MQKTSVFYAHTPSHTQNWTESEWFAESHPVKRDLGGWPDFLLAGVSHMVSEELGSWHLVPIPHPFPPFTQSWPHFPISSPPRAPDHRPPLPWSFLTPSYWPWSSPLAFSGPSDLFALSLHLPYAINGSYAKWDGCTPSITPCGDHGGQGRDPCDEKTASLSCSLHVSQHATLTPRLDI